VISTEDQEQLFALIAEYLKSDLICVAIGGTAMMFMGYKSTTKDIDLVFDSEQERDMFIAAIEELGYKEKAIAELYDEKRREHSGKPRLFTRTDERFDLFVSSVFGYALSTENDVAERRDYLGRGTFTIHLPTKEDLIVLKAITRREKDHEDIETIITTEKTVDWDRVIDKAIAQTKRNEWLLIELEATLQELKSIADIPKRHFERVYEAQERLHGNRKDARHG